MGNLFGDDSPSESEKLINEQIRQSKEEAEAKKQSLFQTRLDIIKSQGQQNWTPDRAHSVGGMKNNNQGSLQWWETPGDPYQKGGKKI